MSYIQWDSRWWLGDLEVLGHPEDHELFDVEFSPYTFCVTCYRMMGDD